MKVEHENKEWNAHEERQEVKIDFKIDEYSDKFIGMIREFEFMWHGHLRRIGAAKQRIKLTPDKIRPVQFEPREQGQEQVRLRDGKWWNRKNRSYWTRLDGPLP